MTGGHGAVVIGSAMSGGVKSVYAHDCVIDGTMQGIRLKSMRGRGGYVKDVRFENIEINNTTDQAIQINMFYGSSTVIPKTAMPSDFSDIQIKNINGNGNKLGIQIKGLPEHRLRDISLSEIRLGAESSFECSDVEGLNINNVNIERSI